MPQEVTRALIGSLGAHDTAAIAELVARARTSTDPIALVAAALVDPSAATLLKLAAELAGTTRERQTVIVAAAHLRGDHQQVDLLARDHLADHPDDAVVGWIAAQHCH